MSVRSAGSGPPPPRPPGECLPRFGPNECLYQFVSIVFEYFCAFVTILIPCGRAGLDRCSPFYICVPGFYF